MALSRVRLHPLHSVIAAAFGLGLVLSSSLVIGADDGEPPLVPEEKPEATPSGVAAFKNRLHEWGLTGSLRGAYWSSNRRLDDEQSISDASVWLKLDRKMMKNWGIFVEGYLNSEDPFGYRKNTNRFREAYIEGRVSDWDFRLGKQIIAWGRADRFNPTDNLTPRDFTLLAPETDEDRFGSVAAKASWNWNASTSLTTVWLPVFRPHVLTFPSQPGVSIDHNIPDSYRQWAVKLDQSGKAVDWSVSYFDGFDLTPDISPGDSIGRLINLRHNRTRVIGADAATTLGSFRLATELAYTRTADSDDNDPNIKNSFWYGIVGIERTFPDDLTINSQLFARRVDHYSNPEDIANPVVHLFAVQNAILNNQYDKQQFGVTFRVSKKWLNETLEGEVAGSLLLSRAGYLIRPKLAYAWSDSIKLIGGVEYFGGSDKTSYGRQEKNHGVFAEFRYYF